MNDWLEKVHAHADGELSGAEKGEVDALLARDPQAAAEHQWAVYLKGLLFAKHVKPNCTDAWNGGVARLDAIDALQGSSKVESFVGRFSWGFAAALFAVILFAGFLNRGAGHVSDQQLAGIFMSTTDDRSVNGAAEAESYVRRGIGAPLPAIAPVVQVTKVGRGRSDGREFYTVSLRDNSGDFELYIFQGADEFESLEPIPGRNEFTGGRVNDHSCVAWAMGNITYMLVAPRTIDEVVAMADRMKR
jgi:hypothetical protein